MLGQDYVVDPADPRAPSEEVWAAMSPAEQARVLEQLPSEFPRDTAPEGDAHREPKEHALTALREYFRRSNRPIYLSAELPVYYAGERVFAPDLIAVLDVEPTRRRSWVVSAERRGLDFVLEVTLSGDRTKDLEENVLRFARLRIPEYFVLDLKVQRILGYRLPTPRARSYTPIVPQEGRWESRILGLDLAFEEDRVRFYAGATALPNSGELIVRLDGMVEKLVSKERQLELQLAEANARADRDAARAERDAARADREAERADRSASRAEQEAERAEQSIQGLRESLQLLCRILDIRLTPAQLAAVNSATPTELIRWVEHLGKYRRFEA